ncbi:MAG: hypothetical protein ACT4P2_08460 [Pseudomonadota bacterium]
MNPTEDLGRRAEAGNPIRVALVGVGEMGTDIVPQVSLMRGIEVATLAAQRLEQGINAFAVAVPPPRAGP